MTTWGHTNTRMLCSAVVGLTAMTASAETRIDNPLDEVNAHYAVASKHFGDGKVQVHTRADNGAAQKHTVYTVNCKDQTYRTDFEGDAAPEVFPSDVYDDPTQPLNRDAAAVPMVKYACEEHGHPLLEWRW